jgi:hypothetical protein
VFIYVVAEAESTNSLRIPWFQPFLHLCWVLTFEDRLAFFLAMCLLYAVLPILSTKGLI